MGEWKYTSTVLDFGNRGEISGQSKATAPLPPGNSLVVPLDRRLGGPQSRPGHYGEEKIIIIKYVTVI
jgi:hypothetical protein